ncbi:hypothetical protein FL583_15740 [Cryptosporangium phraense]|uniref:Uncharacterized protein n=1 Tax=Cryptosporangium phraense TaxID=2593070 RepID=A0A545ARF3_9ACTN|nr:hypothetical protein FL583_15740 [Cryptosporangium phraense]
MQDVEHLPGLFAVPAAQRAPQPGDRPQHPQHQRQPLDDERRGEHGRGVAGVGRLEYPAAFQARRNQVVQVDPPGRGTQLQTVRRPAHLLVPLHQQVPVRRGDRRALRPRIGQRRVEIDPGHRREQRRGKAEAHTRPGRY